MTILGIETSCDETAAAIKQTVIAAEKAIGTAKRYMQLTIVIAAKLSAKAQRITLNRARVSAGSPPSCQARITEKKYKMPTTNPAARKRSQ